MCTKTRPINVISAGIRGPGTGYSLARGLSSRNRASSHTLYLFTMILRSTCRTISPTLSLSSRRKQSTSSLDQWIKEITSNKTTHDDTIDSLRAAQLLRSLPTRQDRSSVQVNDGDVLDQGHHMIYFQPETMLRDLGQDGSSPVCPPLLLIH
jgi:hypothetical protein